MRIDEGRRKNKQAAVNAIPSWLPRRTASRCLTFPSGCPP